MRTLVENLLLYAQKNTLGLKYQDDSNELQNLIVEIPGLFISVRFFCISEFQPYSVKFELEETLCQYTKSSEVDQCSAEALLVIICYSASAQTKQNSPLRNIHITTPLSLVCEKH